jgi:hypothetical protein
MGARAESAQDHGCASTHRSDGKVDREPRSDEDERRIALERVKVNAGKGSKSQAPTFRKVPNYPLRIWDLELGRWRSKSLNVKRDRECRAVSLIASAN